MLSCLTETSKTERGLMLLLIQLSFPVSWRHLQGFCSNAGVNEAAFSRETKDQWQRSSTHIPHTVHSGRLHCQPHRYNQSSCYPTDSLNLQILALNYSVIRGTPHWHKTTVKDGTFKIRIKQGYIDLLHVCKSMQGYQEQVNVSYLLEDFAVGLQLILLTEHFPGAQTVSLWITPGSVFKHLIQRVHPGVQPSHQLLLAVDGPVRPCWVSANWACLNPASPLQVGASSREEVPGYEGDDRVDPDHRAEDLQKQGVHILLQLHLWGWSHCWRWSFLKKSDNILRFSLLCEILFCSKLTRPATQRHNMKLKNYSLDTKLYQHIWKHWMWAYRQKTASW